MTSEPQQYDVFVSYAHGSADVARKAIDALRGSGISVTSASDILAGEQWQDRIWEAITECQSLVLVLPESGELDANSAVEIGAAMAWNKPVYAVVESARYAKLPLSLSGRQVIPLSRVSDIAGMIAESREPLSDDDVDILESLYKQVDTPVDALQLQPKKLGELTSKFNAKSGKQLSGEQVVRALLGLRKRGRLATLRRKRR